MPRPITIRQSSTDSVFQHERASVEVWRVHQGHGIGELPNGAGGGGGGVL